MKLAVSNIAWSSDEEPAAASLLNKLEIKYIETAPTKKWTDPLQANPQQVNNYIDFWKTNNLEIVAFQSMLFNRPDLKIFESEISRVEALEYLKGFIKLAGQMGAAAMVFGSPKNRQRGELSYKEAFSIAKDFFGELGRTAKSHGTIFCIEPNPEQYSCDFVTTAQQGIELVEAVGQAGFGLHLDMGGMTLAGDNVEQSIKTAAPLLHHFHISAPYLESVEDRPDVDYKTAIKAMHSIDYKGYISIEMKPGENNLARTKKAVKFAQDLLS